MIGRAISHYEVIEELGRGGMGVLYRARDTRLERTVAIKVLRPDAISSIERRQRFVREAQAASALNHPRIVTIYDIDQYKDDGLPRDFIAMEYVDGTPLDKRLAAGPLDVDAALDCAVQVAEALAAAHEAGIVHRDIKPGNIMLTKRGDVKLVDFGLAKLTEAVSQDSALPTRSVDLQTEEGAVIGTAAYMSPEQAEGRSLDRRTDIFSFGSVLYEMLTGHRAFQGDSQITTRMAILGRVPSAVRKVRSEVPAELERVVSRCLEKSRDARYASGAELLEDLRRVKQRRAMRQGAFWSRPKRVVPAVLAALLIVAVGAWLWVRNNRVRWARYEALPAIAKLTAREDYIAAFDLIERARSYLPGDPELERLRNTVSSPVSVRTEPAGAAVSWKDYAQPQSAWQTIGPTPVAARLPNMYKRWRFEMNGFEASERAASFRLGELTLTLTPQGTQPDGMVSVPPGQREIGGKTISFEGYWLDKFEVTNRRFKEFVDAGGYRKREYWKQPFIKDMREVAWEEGVRSFLDKTGRPGPALWELGHYLAGEDDIPVRGVSWFEAAAFAEFEGKSLPTAWHWLRATDPIGPPAVVELSNFGGKGPAPVGLHQGLGPFGTYDMAGNVREWVWNASGEKRSSLGGDWTEAVYTYTYRYAISPFERPETYGFRLAKYQKPPAPELLAPIERTWRDYAREKPVDDKTFAVYAGFYAYDKLPLTEKTAPVVSGSPHWRQERVEYAAAYGGERIPADLYLPANAGPPFQTVLYFPGSGAQTLTRLETWDRQFLDFIIQSGRAVLYPVYKGTYERRLSAFPASRSSARRDLLIQDYKDLARSVDYLETRRDIDLGKLAYYGFSWGAQEGLNYTALEKRFKASILLAGGLSTVTFAPEIDMLNFAPRITVPTLMLNGRADFTFPLEESQKPMFRLLGAKEKQHTLVPGGHSPPRLEIIKATLEWLDRYLGPVETHETQG